MSAVAGKLTDMTDETWRPLGMDDAEAATYDALHEGIPHWLQTSFWTWMRGSFTSQVGRPPRDVFNRPLLREAERVCRFSTEYERVEIPAGVEAIRRVFLRNDLGALRVADFLLSRVTNVRAVHLEDMLVQTGSAWKVGTRSGKPGLVRRVPEGVQTFADATMASAGMAGQRLAQAWERAFGINPDAPGAYAMAVKAVEDAAIPVVIPRQSEPTLGHVIGRLRADGDWSLPLTREDPDAPTSGTVLKLAQALWKGHHDRHGGQPPGSLPEVTQEEAETAVSIAVPLVHWFSTGLVARR
jgi:hypothetical protein